MFVHMHPNYDEKGRENTRMERGFLAK